MLTVSVKGWMRSSESCKYILGCKHSLPLKGKILPGGEVTLFGFPWGGQPLAEVSWQETAQWLLARPVGTSDPLSGPQELLLPQKEEGGGVEGKAPGEARGLKKKKKNFPEKRIGCQGTELSGWTPMKLLAFRGSWVLFCLFVTLSTS